MMNKKCDKFVNHRISILKVNALKLRANYQIPYYLTYLITKLDKCSDVSLVVYLRTQCEHMLRVKGYYKKYPQAEEECERILKQYWTKYIGKGD